MSLWWIHCDIDGSGNRWRLAVDRGYEVYFPIEDFSEEMPAGKYRVEFPKNVMIPVQTPGFDPREGAVPAVEEEKES